MTLNEIYTKAGLDTDEIRRMPYYIKGTIEDDFFYSTEYNKLYEYFLDSGEMPYGVATADTGEPDLWIIEKLEVICEAR